MQRRNLLRAAGGIGAAGAVGIGGTFFLTGGAAAQSDADLIGAEGDAIWTSDGGIEYVAYGGLVRFEWEYLDTEATHGEIETESTVQGGDGFKNHGAVSGPLGDGSGGSFDEGEGNTSDSWGGENDSNSGTGQEGFFQFKFGHPFGEPSYAIAYEDDGYEPRDQPFEYGNAFATMNPWDPSLFEANTEGGQNTTTVTVRQICRVYDQDPEGAEPLVEDVGEAAFDIVVGNREGEGTTSGEFEGQVGGEAEDPP